MHIFLFKYFYNFFALNNRYFVKVRTLVTLIAILNSNVIIDITKVEEKIEKKPSF